MGGSILGEGEGLFLLQSSLFLFFFYTLKTRPPIAVLGLVCASGCVSLSVWAATTVARIFGVVAADSPLSAYCVSSGLEMPATRRYTSILCTSETESP